MHQRRGVGAENKDILAAHARTLAGDRPIGNSSDYSPRPEGRWVQSRHRYPPTRTARTAFDAVPTYWSISLKFSRSLKPAVASSAVQPKVPRVEATKKVLKRIFSRPAGT